jgi:dihydroneopterin aldolase/D-erythro-7,8-dihydroneopterin triphosphate epimerase
MADTPLDRIHIRDLLVRCILGIYPDERREKQDVIVNITLYADLRKACLSDDIDDTVDYKTIKKNVLQLVQQSEYFLVERLVERIAELALETAAVQRVDVSVDKPGALRFARSVAVEISRFREG